MTTAGRDEELERHGRAGRPDYNHMEDDRSSPHRGGQRPSVQDGDEHDRRDGRPVHGGELKQVPARAMNIVPAVAARSS